MELTVNQMVKDFSIDRLSHVSRLLISLDNLFQDAKEGDRITLYKKRDIILDLINEFEDTIRQL